MDYHYAGAGMMAAGVLAAGGGYAAYGGGCGGGGGSPARAAQYVRIEGATDKNGFAIRKINGDYLKTADVCNGRAVYRKVGASTKALWMHEAGMWFLGDVSNVGSALGVMCAITAGHEEAPDLVTRRPVMRRERHVSDGVYMQDLWLYPWMGRNPSPNFINVTLILDLFIFIADIWFALF